MNLAEYTMRLLLRFKALELAKIEYPAFNVIDIWQNGDKTYALVDNIEPLKEVAKKEDDGTFAYLGIYYIPYIPFQEREESEEE